MVKKIIVLVFFYFIFIPLAFSHCGDCGDCGVGDHKKKDRASCASNKKSEACDKKRQCSHKNEKETEAHTSKTNKVGCQSEPSEGETPQSLPADPTPASKQESN